MCQKCNILYTIGYIWYYQEVCGKMITMPPLYVKKTKLTVKLKPTVIKAATESHNIQISKTIQ